ncbi:tetratricopeptide repeat protein [Pannus brasiliensis]|uniref:tetratricopeptide repeat protein n=1 Tax=Pannus brasiliensis TaxID=1579216 RepID=UPI002FCDC069
MTESSKNLSEIYGNLIDRVVALTLEGKIRSKSQVYRFLTEGIEVGTGEIFERCLSERVETNRAKADGNTKAGRILRALETIETEWEKWQKENQQATVTTGAIDRLANADRDERLQVLLYLIDPNQPEALSADQLSQLSNNLRSIASARSDADLFQLVTGITVGLKSWSLLSGDLTGWIYERESLGFAKNERANPWSLWASKLESSWLQRILQATADGESFDALTSELTLTDWVETAVVFPYLQRGLIQFFDRQIYSEQLGARLSISTFLTFAVLWSRLAMGFDRAAADSRYSRGCFQITLQILRTFARRDYFPLYGGIFASFSGTYFREAMDYLSIPLLPAEGTTEKARILTLLGYSSRARGDYRQAIEFHRQALEIAREANDRPCEVANLNHLARLQALGKNHAEAIDLSQRALILGRQYGDSLGQANALANLGYSEVQRASQLERPDPELYERSIEYLQQGLKLAGRLQDGQSRSLCCSSLGMAYVILEQPEKAIEILLEGLQSAKYYGDLYLQGLILTYLAEAYYQDRRFTDAIYTGAMGMYWLHEIGAIEWRQAASLLTILKGQRGEEFEKVLETERSEIIKAIGSNGYDTLWQILAKYQEER